MIRDVLANLHWTALPVLSMLLFAAVFVGVLFWVFRKESNSIYHAMGQLPLQDDRDGGKV